MLTINKNSYKRKQLINANKFDKNSFKTIDVGDGKTKLIVGCLKGKYDKDKKICKIGLKAQAILISTNKFKTKGGDIVMAKKKTHKHGKTKGKKVGKGKVLVSKKSLRSLMKKVKRLCKAC